MELEQAKGARHGLDLSINSILQGMQLKLQSGRTRSDRPCSVFAKLNKSIIFYLQACFM